MKYTKYIYIIFFAFALLSSCEEVTETPSLGEGNAPELMSPDGTLSYVFTEDNEESPFETFIYSAATFSQPIVTEYVIEIADGADDAFETKFDMQEATSQLYQSISIKDFNLLMGSAGLNVTPEVPTTVNVRVRAGNANDSVQVLYSNVVKLDITPYDAVIPPIYIVGNAVSEWDPSKALPIKSTDVNEYSEIITFKAGIYPGDEDDPNYRVAFRFLETNTAWDGNLDHKAFDVIESDPAGVVIPDAVENDTNFIITEAGDYLVEVNLDNSGKKTVKFTKQ